MAAKTESSSRNMVSTRTPMRGLVRVMVRVASIPLPPGMCRSMTTTSGCNSAASLTASGPLAAWARSEERRVGKECRARGAREHEIKKEGEGEQEEDATVENRY